MADAGATDKREAIPDWFRVPAANPSHLARLERQVAAGIITPAEFGRMATDELVLLAPPELDRYCRVLAPVLARALHGWAAEVLATPAGLLHSHGHIPPRAKTPERSAWLAGWMEPRYRRLLAAVVWATAVDRDHGAEG